MWDLAGRDRIKEGFYAGLAVLDSETFRDASTYLEPDPAVKGAFAIFLNGKQFSGKKPEETFCGRVLIRRKTKQVNRCLIE